MTVQTYYFSILWICLLISTLGFSFSDSYVSILHSETFNDNTNYGNWILFFRDTSFEMHDEMNVNIDYLSAKYNNQINVGYIDCTTEKNICESMGVTRFPTIKLAVNHVFHDYFGRTSLRSLTDVCNALASEPINIINDESDFDAFIQKDNVVFLCVYDNSPESQLLLSDFKNASQQLLLYSTFGITNQPILNLPPIQPPYVIRIEEDEDFEYFTLDTQQSDSLYSWIRQRTLPILPEYRGNYFNDIILSDKLTLLVLIDSSRFSDLNEINQIKTTLRALSYSLKKKFAFAFLDGMEWGEYIQQYGVSSKDLPCAIVLHERTGYYYKPVELSAKAIDAYLTRIATNQLSPSMYSMLRYQFSRFMKAFMRFSYTVRVFLSLTFTFFLAILTLKVIFFFQKPAQRVHPKPKEEKPKDGMRKRHIHYTPC